MSDEIEVGPAAREAAMLAVLSAGDPGNQKRWRKAVQTNLPMFAALVRDGYGWYGKEAQEIIDADIFTSTFLSMELEETSTRLILNLQSDRAKSDKNPEGLEHIRTERTDSPRGWTMRDRLEQLQPGAELVIWKKTESISADMKVRVLVHFEQIRSKNSTNNEEKTPNRPARPPTPAGGASSSSTEPTEGSVQSPSVGSHTDTIQRNLEGLPARAMLAVKNRCVGEGINDWMNPSDDHLDRVLVIISNVKKEAD